MAGESDVAITHAEKSLRLSPTGFPRYADRDHWRSPFPQSLLVAGREVHPRRGCQPHTPQSLHDSPLEGTGFEPSVPRVALGATGEPRASKVSAQEPSFLSIRLFLDGKNHRQWSED